MVQNSKGNQKTYSEKFPSISSHTYHSDFLIVAKAKNSGNTAYKLVVDNISGG